MGLYWVCLSVFLVQLSTGLGDDDQNTTQLTWPTKYYFKGEHIYLTGGVTEPFEIWYRKKNNRARMDLYGGLVRKYYEKGFLGATTYTIHYQTTSTGLVVRQCYEDMDVGEKVKGFLPSVDGFTYKGQEMIGDKRLELWEAVNMNTSEGFDRYHAIYVDRFDKYHIPVRYVYKKFLISTESLDIHRITHYYDFKSNVTKNDVRVQRGPDGNICDDLTTNSRPSSLSDDTFDVEAAFHGFKHLHNKEYDQVENDKRKSIFKKNLKHIEEHNRQNLGYTLKVTSFADKSDEELQSIGCILPPDPEHLKTEYTSYVNEELEEMIDEYIPEELDMRLRGLLNPVRNQLSCGSCWAFSSTGTVEGALAMKNGGKLLDLSEQSLVDCGWSTENWGCKGGMMDRAMMYVYSKGIPTEREYGTYLMEDGECKISNMSEIYQIKNFGQVTVGSAAAMKAALNRFGPVAVSLFAGKNMQLYSSGIFYDPDCESGRRNHAVIVVGYGMRDGAPYWLVRNSWGDNWGEGGYILISAKDNHCHLLNEAFYVVV